MSKGKILKTLTAGLVALVLISTSIAVLRPNTKTVEAGGPNGTTSDDGTQAREQSLTESNQAILDKNQPAPTMSTSLERDNLIRRLKFINNANQLGYVYLLSLDGKVINWYTVKGKVSSLESYITTTDQVRCPGSEGRGCVTLASPDIDGSYGKNPSGIFFFTTEGTYVEWSGTYVYSSQQLNIQTPLSLTKTVQ